MTWEEAQDANAKAKREALADPVAVATELAACAWTANRLQSWPDPWADGADIPPTEGGRVHSAWIAAAASGHLAQVRDAPPVHDPEGFRQLAAGWAIGSLAALPEAPDSETGLSMLGAWWARRPPTVEAETRPDPLLPVVRVAESPEREAGRLAFGGVVEGRDLPAQLPLLPTAEGPRVPLLELADVRGGPIMARGRGAPLDLRLFVGACLWTPHRARSERVRLAVTVRELRNWLWPNGWERRRDLPKLRAALWRARDYTIPDGRGLWLPFALRRDPGAGAALDDVALIDVELPPGAGDGPVIDRRALAAVGVESAPRFRALIAAHSVAWLPGRTRIPHPRNRAFRLWAGDPGKYPILTADDRRRLAFGEADRRNRTRANQAAPWEDLPGVEIVTKTATTEDGRRGWLIAPSEAAEAIRKRQDREGANRRTRGR